MLRMDEPSPAESASRRQNELLRALAVQLREPGRSLDDDLRLLSKAAAEFLEVTRASVWLFDDAHDVLECAVQFERADGRFGSGQRLLAEQYPEYFAACADVQALAVDDVFDDPRVHELKAYFEAAGIEAMLDAPIFVGAAALGVVCHEDAGGPRAWTDEEQAFAGAIAQLASNSVAAARWGAREEALQRSEALYRSIVEDFTDFIVRADPDGVIRDVNRAAGLIHGSDPAALRGRTVFELVPAEEHRIFLNAVRGCTPRSPVVHYTHHVLAKDDAWRMVDWTSRAFFDASGALTGYQAIGRDVTEARHQEASLREAQRLEALAMFSGGMAHDLNNLLTPILVLSDSAVSSLPPDRPEVSDLREVSAAALRARALVRQVLMFARPSEGPDREPIDPAPFIDEAARFVRATAPPTIEHELEVSASCGVVEAAPSDLFQIVSNLCANAVQAMPAGGQLRVVARAEGANLRIEVCDDGVGISRDVAPRIFDPFFTTKPSGKGTGLGLSVIRRLVEDLGGRISFDSEPGRGTTFVVLLPVIQRRSSPSRGAERRSTGLAGTERVLVVDDEPTVLRSVSHGLRALGYAVETASSAREALSRLDQASFDAVVTDQMMPQMSGAELAEAIAARHRGLPVVLMSGADAAAHADAKGVVAAIAKPFQVPELAVCLRDALGRGSEAGA